MGNDQSKLADGPQESTEEILARVAKDEEAKYQKIYAMKRAAKASHDREETDQAVNADSTGAKVGAISHNTESERDTVSVRSKGSSGNVNGSDLLATFNPRKAPLPKPKDNKSEQSSSDEFIGFGYETTMQEQSHQSKQELPKVNAMAKGKAGSQNDSAGALPKPGGPAGRTASFAGLKSAKRTSNATAPSSSKKRPSTNAFSNERRPSLSNLPKIPKRTSLASPQSPNGEHDETAGAGERERPPAWYKATQSGKRLNDALSSNADVLLASLNDKIKKRSELGSETSKNKFVLEKLFTEVREKLHTAMFVQVNRQVLANNRMLSNGLGLSAIFAHDSGSDVDWPFDIKADAEELYNKWSRQEFSTDIMRGIQFLGDDGSSIPDRIDDKWKKKVISAKYFGDGDLLNGSWWPLQICALRDGAHGVSQGGISGQAGQGAYSCIMSGGHDYPDVDEGHVVLYCGTDSFDGSITEYTQRLIESVKTGNPIRLIRSHKLQSPYAPLKGFRYDGNYVAVSMERLDPVTSLRQRHRFRLERCPGQDPIRGGNGPERRPTNQELEAYKTHQRRTKRDKGGSD